MRLGGIYVSWKVLAALGLGVVAVLAVEPRLIPIILPLALVLACPLSCLLMMRSMGGQQSTSDDDARELSGQDDRIAKLREELSALKAEYEQTAATRARNVEAARDAEHPASTG